MTNLIRSEWIKFRSVRSTVVTLLLAGVIVVLVAVLAGRNADQPADDRCVPTSFDQESSGAPATTDGPCPEGFEVVSDQVPVRLTDLTGGVSFAVLLFGVLGVQVIGQEYRFNTIRPTFTAAPDRFKVLVAKTIVVSVACAVVSVVMLAFCWLAGTAIVDAFATDGVDVRVAWGIVLFSSLWAAAGVAVGAIVRQPIAGILVLLGWSLVLESLIGGLIDGAYQWMPFTNGFQMTFRIGEDSPELRGILEGGIYFAAVAAVLWGLGAYLVNKRDA